MVALTRYVARAIILLFYCELAGIVDSGNPFAQVVGEGSGHDAVTHDVPLHVARGGVGVGGERSAPGVPHAGQAPGAVVGVARLAAVRVDQAADAPCEVVDVGDRPGAGQAVNGDLLDAHVAEVVVGVAVDHLGGRVGIGVLLDLYEEALGVAGPTVIGGIAVVVSHTASPGDAVVLEGVAALRIEG